VTGGLIAAYWLADGYVIGLPVAALAAFWNPLIVFVAALAVVIPINLAACSWIDREWSTWSGGSGGARIQKQLEKAGTTRVGASASRWISSGSDTRFAVAAAATCAILTVTLARSVGGQPLGGHRVRLAAFSYAIFFIGLFTVIGVLAGDVIRSV
jgi:hypothetical protein